MIIIRTIFVVLFLGVVFGVAFNYNEMQKSKFILERSSHERVINIIEYPTTLGDIQYVRVSTDSGHYFIDGILSDHLSDTILIETGTNGFGEPKSRVRSKQGYYDIKEKGKNEK